MDINNLPPYNNETILAFAFDGRDPLHHRWIEALNLQPYIQYSLEDVQEALATVLETGDLEACEQAVRAFESFRGYLGKWLEQQLERMNLLATEHGDDAVFALEVDWEGNLYSMNVVENEANSEASSDE